MLRSVTFLRAITRYIAFTPDFGYDNSTIILIGDVYCPITKCWVRLCLHENTFQSLGRGDSQGPQCASVCQVRNFPFEGQRMSFFLSLGQGAYIFEGSAKPIQDVIGDVFCPGKYCSKREKCESLDGYVTNPRPIFACGKCGAWLFVHKVPFMLQEHVKTTKQTKYAFSLLKNDELVPTKQLSLNVPFQSTKYRRKQLCMDNKVWETIGDVYCATCGNEKCVYISTNKTTKFYDSKKWKACCHVLNVPFKDQKPTIMLFGGDGTHCFARKTSRDYEKEKPSPFLKKFLRQSVPSKSKPAPKKAKSSPNLE